MRTEELMREYAKDQDAKCPSSGWQELVWHAARLLSIARRMRNTNRAKRVVCNDSGFKQDDLF